jgi:hypothetical protein
VTRIPMPKSAVKRISRTPGRAFAPMLTALAMATLGVTAAPTDASPSIPSENAHATALAKAAGVIPVADKGHLHLLHSSGSLLYEEGSVTGQLPGGVKTHFKLTARLTSTTTIYPRKGGSITLSGTGVLHSSGAFSSFSETMTVVSATGPYAHVHGSASLYGVVNRHNFTMTVQSSGKLSD